MAIQYEWLSIWNARVAAALYRGRMLLIFYFNSPGEPSCYGRRLSLRTTLASALLPSYYIGRDEGEAS